MSPDSRCPDISGSYSNQGAGGRLNEVLGLPAAGPVRLEMDKGTLVATSGRARRVLAQDQDFRCTSEGLALSKPMTGGYEISGVLADHVDRYVVLSRAGDGALIGRTTDKERVKFIGPELTAAGHPGPEWRWAPR